MYLHHEDMDAINYAVVHILPKLHKLTLEQISEKNCPKRVAYCFDD